MDGHVAKGGRTMRMACIVCSKEVNLDHVVFENYNGPVKCFSCGSLMEVKTAQGAVDTVALLGEAAIYAGKAGSIGESAA